MDDIRNGWPVVARLMARLQELQRTWIPLWDFSDRCLRGDSDSDTLFLVYAHQMTEAPNPCYGQEWTAFQARLKDKALPQARLAREAPRAIRRSFGEHGLRLLLRFDRGQARRLFPMLSVCDFGDSQISLMTVEGPTTARFRTLEDAIWGVLYDEVTRFEREAVRAATHNLSQFGHNTGVESCSNHS